MSLLKAHQTGTTSTSSCHCTMLVLDCLAGRAFCQAETMPATILSFCAGRFNAPLQVLLVD